MRTVKLQYSGICVQKFAKIAQVSVECDGKAPNEQQYFHVFRYYYNTTAGAHK